MLAIIIAYGPQMFKERWVETDYPKDVIITTDVDRYFKEQGYNALHISPSKDTTNWTAFIIKNGALYIVTVYTDGRTILGDKYSLA
ncbi:MAG: hypothetical protein ACT4ON_03985 [Bacteroidota bacterium]